MNRNIFKKIIAMLTMLLLASCTAMPQQEIKVRPEDIRFSGERAFAIETEFVRAFPNRHSGQPNNRLAAEWLHAQLTNAGWDCQFDEWEIVNYSQTVPLNNVACKLHGASEQEILIAAHHDQASTTIEGADNDASGVSILVHLADIFAAEPQQPYTLAFVFTDAEEYGMIGTARYIDTHPHPDQIIAGVSLDNLGRTYYNGMNMELIGRYRKFAPIWLGVLARDSAEAAGIEWQVYPPILIDQITGQAAPISFMDQGPMVAAGIPALGFTGRVPAEVGDEHYRLWHNPDDTMEKQSAASLDQSGKIAEALIRQLQSMVSFPQDSGPYLYLEGSEQIIRGVPLWSVFIGFTALFFLASLHAGGRSPSENVSEWGKAIPHFLGLWLPFVATVLFLYLLVMIGIMYEFAEYPATTKDPYLLQPRWVAIVLFFAGLVGFLFAGRKLTRKFIDQSASVDFHAVKSLGLFVLGLGALYLLFINPFSLLFFLPLPFWFLINGRAGAGKILDVVFFLLGGLVVYALIYIFGFGVLRYDFAFLWFMLNMFSSGMIGFPTALMITAMLAAGLTMIVNPPHGVTARGSAS